MNWRDFNYATEFMNSGTRNVAVPGIGGPFETMSSADSNQSFKVLGLSVLGYSGLTLTLQGFNHGVFVGSKSYPLSPMLTPLRVPPEWGRITQLTFLCMNSAGGWAPYYRVLAITLK